SPLREARVGGAAGGDAILYPGGHVRGDRPRDPQGAMIPDAWRRGVVAVVGLGKSGVAATQLLAREGVPVYASDASDHPYGGDAFAELRSLDGVTLDVGRHDLARIRSAAAAGNIGRPLADIAVRGDRYQWLVIEVSSFQLHDSPHFAPEIGILTNLAPDHLDRYPTAEAYYADKQLLFQNARPSDMWVLNGDEPPVLELAGGVLGRRALFALRRRVDGWYDAPARRLYLGDEPLLARDELNLLGDH